MPTCNTFVDFPVVHDFRKTRGYLASGGKKFKTVREVILCAEKRNVKAFTVFMDAMLDCSKIILYYQEDGRWHRMNAEDIPTHTTKGNLGDVVDTNKERLIKTMHETAAQFALLHVFRHHSPHPGQEDSNFVPLLLETFSRLRIEVFEKEEYETNPFVGGRLTDASEATGRQDWARVALLLYFAAQHLSEQETQ